MSRKALMIAGAALAILVFPEAVSACPDCKSTVGRAGQFMAMGYATSILLLLATPLFILTGWTYALTRAARRSRLAGQSDQ